MRHARHQDLRKGINVASPTAVFMFPFAPPLRNAKFSFLDVPRAALAAAAVPPRAMCQANSSTLDEPSGNPSGCIVSFAPLRHLPCKLLLAWHHWCIPRVYIVSPSRHGQCKLLFLHPPRLHRFSLAPCAAIRTPFLTTSIGPPTHVCVVLFATIAPRAMQIPPFLGELRATLANASLHSLCLVMSVHSPCGITNHT